MSIIDAVLAAQLAKSKRPFSKLGGVTIGSPNTNPTAFSMSRNRKRLFGIGGGNNDAYISDDYGATWVKPPFLYGGLSMQGIWPTGDGEVLISIKPDPNGQGSLWKSSGLVGWTGSGSIAGSTVLTCVGTDCYVHGGWSLIDADGALVVACEYGAQGEARRLWLSRDFGSTWTLILDLNILYGGGAVGQNHLHGCYIDPWENRIWVCQGDADNRILFSDDLGETWHVAYQHLGLSDGKGQMTPVAAMPGAVLFGCDPEHFGAWKIKRASRPIYSPALKQQTVELTGSPTGGTFALTYRGAVTTPIAYNASAATVQAALEALPTVEATNVTVTGTAPKWTAVFADALAPFGVLQVTGSLTGGTSPAAKVYSTQPGCLALEPAFDLADLGFSTRDFIAQTITRAPQLPGAPALITFLPTDGNTTDPSVVIGTVDGDTFYEVWRDTNGNVGSDRGLFRLIGPDAQGNYHGRYRPASVFTMAPFKATQGPVFPEDGQGAS